MRIDWCVWTAASLHWLLVWGWIPCQAAVPPEQGAARMTPWFEIQCLDQQTGRGVPLIELETVNHLRWVSDNAGRVAIWEPGLMNREIYFHLRGHGYGLPKDGFGNVGIRTIPAAGMRVEIQLARTNLAERLGRITGEGLFRDSQLLGHVNMEEAVVAASGGGVMGQDSIQAAVYQGRVFWFWGDTDRYSYPLGQFRTAGATSPWPRAQIWRPETGIPLEYFVGQDGFSRPMIPLPERPEGVIWIDGLVVVPDKQGKERMVCHYSRRKGLTDELEHGLAVYNDTSKIFEPCKSLPLSEKWRFPHGHCTLVEEASRSWVYCGVPLLHLRVPAQFEAFLDPQNYESFSCFRGGESSSQSVPVRGPDGAISWGWRRDVAPTVLSDELRWLKEKAVRLSETRFLLQTTGGEPAPVLHGGTVRWNEHRRCWIMIAVELGGKSSHLGEVWYGEAASPVGPWRRGVKILTHNRQSFYNPCHHAFLDEQGGRIIHFEGTYVNTFSGNPDATPRYNYNQILYRLDLNHLEMASPGRQGGPTTP